MLFPLAESNLASYLRDTPAPSITKSLALWMLEQLFNLAEGVAHIHILRGAPNTGAENFDEDIPHSDFGYHHDLKPANILIFHGSKGDIWKIGDFGNARINKAVKGQSQKTPNLTMGDPIYESPDWHSDKLTSRPYDIWSLGCIFLEVLVWMFRSKSDEGEGLGAFEVSRSRDNGHHGPAAYWMFDSELQLRPSVTMVLAQLEDRTQGFVRQIVSITARMLNLKPLERPLASWVTDSLKAARVQADIELTEMKPDELIVDDQLFMPLPGSLQFAAPVTLPGAGSGDIDRRSIASARESFETSRLLVKRGAIANIRF